MKAVVLHKFGGPECMSYEDVPDPRPGPGESLLRVLAIGVNYTEVRTRAGAHAHGRVPPFVLGHECVGEVTQVNGGPSPVAVGRRAYVYHWRFCSVCEFCEAGSENLCTSDPQKAGRTDVELMEGSYAEYRVAPLRCLIPLPDELSDEESAALPVTGGSAWHNLFDRGRVRAGETVLVLAAGSGLGSVAVQMCKMAGCRVITTTGTQEKVERALQLGADAAINYNTQDVSREVKRLTGGRGVDVVFETTGAGTFAQSMASLAVGGRILVAGKNTGSKVSLDLLYSMPRDWQIIDSVGFTRRNVRQVYQLAVQGKIRPVIHSTLPLKEVRRAHELMESPDKFGKIIMVP